ncbi:MAG: amidohydrolase [Clostridiales bacterium]|nr:amidohydrolase [Clostridiales bacterium]
MIIDANVYWFPEQIFEDDTLLEQFLSEIPTIPNTAGYVKENGDKKQIVIERPIGFAGVDYLQGEYTLEGHLSALKEAGVDQAVMKVPCCHEWLSLDMCRLFNDGMADYAKRSGGVLHALAVIPPWGTAQSLAELDRCYALGMRGVQLCAHYRDLYLDDAAFAPLFEKLNELHMTAYIHHTPVPVEFDAVKDYNNLRRSYGRCCDQMIAVSRELFSGMFTRYPNVRVVHSMLGGGFHTYANMMLPPKPQMTDTAARFSQTTDEISTHMQRNIFFEMSHAQPWGKDQLECAIKTLGADHIIYGSSYPVRREWLMGGTAFVQNLDITEEEKALILGGNAQRLYVMLHEKEIAHV